MNTPQQLPTTNEKQFLHQYTPGALLPFTQAFLTSLIVFVSVYVVLWIAFDVLDPHKPALILAMGALLITWLSRMRMWSALARWEQWTGIDLNNDGVIGDQAPAEDEPRTSKVRIELSKVKDGHFSASSFDLPRGVTEEHLAQIAHDMFVIGKSFAETELTGTGKISLPKFRQLRVIMERQSLCEKIGSASNAPFELTDEGEAWLRAYLPSPTPPMESL